MAIQHISCGPFVNASEERALQTVKATIEEYAANREWVILTNWMMSPIGSSEPIEVDMIVIGPHEVFVIEVKHWKWSRVDDKGNRAQLLRDVNLLQAKVKRIAGRMRSSESPAPVGYVRGVFLLTDEKTPRLLSERVAGGEFCVCVKDQLRSLLIDEGDPKYSSTIIREYGRWLTPPYILPLGSPPRVVNDIRLVRQVSPRGDNRHRIYEGRKGPNGIKVELHLIDLTVGSAASAKQAEREVQALQALHEHGKWVPQIVDSLQDVDMYVGEMKFYCLADSDAPPLKKRAEDQSWERSQRLNFAVSALTGLAELQALDASSGKTDPFVHRNISPTTLLVRHNDRALFTGFDISRVPGTETISHAIAKPSPDTPWLAPELIEHGFGAANASTDVFALCRTLQTAFSVTDEVHAVLERGAAHDSAQRSTAWQVRDEVRKLMDAFVVRTSATAPHVPSAEYWSEGTVVEFRDHHYRVAQRLGEGGMGMTYRVVQVIGADQDGAVFVAKTAKSDQDARRLIESYALARPVTDTGLARMHEFVASDKFVMNSFVALLEYLAGYALSEYRGIVAAICDERSESLPEPMNLQDQIEQWLRSILGALSAMHRSGCVHGDVSAANIIVRPEQSYAAKLTDFDLVTRVGQTLASSGTPRYCAPESKAGEAARASHDVYALAAVLFDVAFGRDPFSGKGKVTGIVWGSGEREMLGRIAEFLDKATHPDPSQRFGDADAALRWLDATVNAFVEPVFPIVKTGVEATNSDVQEDAGVALVPGPVVRSEAPAGAFKQQEIPWLRELLSTYPASFVGNAETRGLESSFARDTYVETDLDRYVADELRAGKAQLVILCGNAGDGKTAFLQKLAEKFGLPNVYSAQRLWKHTLPDGRRMLLNLDGAAAWGARSADDLMDEVMQPFRDGRPQPELLHLVAVNNGRLLEWIERSGESRLTNYLRSVLLGDEIESGEEIAHVRYIDLNERSLVGSADEANADEVPRFIDELIDRMSGASAAQTWAPCATCSAQARCTARRSMTALEVPARRTRIVKQLSRALQAVHQRGRVHITTRELRGALTYIFFGVHYCTNLHADPSLEPAPYWDRAFDAESLRRQGDVLGELVTLDPALDSHPILDRELRRMARREGDAAGLGSLRRRAYFEATDDELKKMARSEGALPLFRGAHYGEFARVGEMDEHEMRVLVRKLCAGIAQLETLPNIVLNRLDAGMVPLKVLPRTPIESVFWVEKKLERFSLRAEKPRTSEPIDWLPNRAALEYEYGDGRRETLWMSSALFALLLEVADGNRLMGEASRDTFANLSIFTQRLAEEQATELFAWEPTKDRAVHRIWIDRSEVAGGGRQLLRLEEVSRG